MEWPFCSVFVLGDRQEVSFIVSRCGDRFELEDRYGQEYPFSESTLGDKLAAGKGLSVHCFGCQRRAVLDVAELVKRFGPDQPCLHWDLLKIIYCHECHDAGRDDGNLQFTNHAVTPEQRKSCSRSKVAERSMKKLHGGDNGRRTCEFTQVNRRRRA